MLTKDQTDLLDERIVDLCAALPVTRNERYQILPPVVVRAQPLKRGQRWQRLINSENGVDKSLRAWVDRTNGMLTYGAWKAPNKNRQGVPAYRYDLLDDDAFATLMVRVLTEPAFWLYEDNVTRACH